MAETDYGDYLQHRSNLLNGLFLYCGFSFTAITVLISILPNPQNILAQTTLFFLFVMLEVFQIQIAYIMSENSLLCRNVPQLTRRSRRFNLTILLSQSFWSIAIILMFLLADLNILALLGTIMYIVAVTFGYKYILHPLTLKQSGF